MIEYFLQAISYWQRLVLSWVVFLVAGCASPQAQCPRIADTFEVSYIPAAETQSSDRLMEFFNLGKFPTADLMDVSASIHIAGTIHRRQDINNDALSEIFLSATQIPTDESDIVGIWTDYFILRCQNGKYSRLFQGTYQNLYQQYSVAVINDENNNTFPEVRILDIYTHWGMITHTTTLEWNGSTLGIIEENAVYGPTGIPFP